MRYVPETTGQAGPAVTSCAVTHPCLARMFFVSFVSIVLLLAGGLELISLVLKLESRIKKAAELTKRSKCVEFCSSGQLILGFGSS